MADPGFPSAEDFIRAVQSPEKAFTVPSLRRADFDLHPILGIPLPATGRSAVVFRARVDARPCAVRFPLRVDPHAPARFRAIGEFVAARDLAGHVAAGSWIDDAIVVGGRRWPAVVLPWVEGKVLDFAVTVLLDEGGVASVTALALRWRSMIDELQRSGFAHGELAPANVIVDDAGGLPLVDLDSAWVPTLDGRPPPTFPVDPGQDRPERTWGRWMDTFPSLVIYLALVVAARAPALWRRHNNGSGTIFSAEDLGPPFGTAVWQDLANLGDSNIDRLAELLRDCCAPSWTATGSLEDLLAAAPPRWGTTSLPSPPPLPRPSAGAVLSRAPGPTPQAGDDDVQFTVFRPRVVRPLRPATLIVFAHRSTPFVDDDGGWVDPARQVDSRIRGLLGSDMPHFAPVVADSAAALPRGTELTIEPWIDGGVVDPARAAFRWERPVHQVEFTFSVPGHLDGRRLSGGVRVLLGVLVLADIRFFPTVHAGAGEAAPEPAASAHPYRKIFASYSHRDSAIVERVRAAAASLGDEYLIDVEQLRVAEQWRPAIADLITQSDVFQLFWSTNAMRSEFVRQEWLHALSLGRPRFVRPLYWEDPLPRDSARGLPPPALGDLHFWRLAPALGTATPPSRSVDSTRPLGAPRPADSTDASRSEPMCGTPAPTPPARTAEPPRDGAGRTGVARPRGPAASAGGPWWESPRGVPHAARPPRAAGSPPDLPPASAPPPAPPRRTLRPAVAFGAVVAALVLVAVLVYVLSR